MTCSIILPLFCITELLKEFSAFTVTFLRVLCDTISKASILSFRIGKKSKTPSIFTLHVDFFVSFNSKYNLFYLNSFYNKIKL